MDRNQVIGLVLITVIMMGYFMYIGNQPAPPKTQPKKEIRINASASGSDSLAAMPDSLLHQKLGSFSALGKGEAKEDVLENENLQITFNSKGGLIQKVWLKKFKTFDQKPLYLLDTKNNIMDFSIQTNSGPVLFKDLYFKPSHTDSSLSYRADLNPGQYIEQVYKLTKEGYLLNYDLRFVGMDAYIKNDPVKLYWQLGLRKTERDIQQSRAKSTVNYYTEEDHFDNLSMSNEPQDKKLEEPVKWVSLKEKFFSSAIISKGDFARAELSSKSNESDTVIVKELSAKLDIPVGDVKSGKGSFQFYFGPNQFSTLNDIDAPAFHKNVDLGWPGISFINRFIVIPVFHFFEGVVSNYGIIIIILVILLKLILFPLSYKSYIAMAKMKVLKPEIDEIKEKHGDDMQKTQMETMELYRKVGINPLSGCIPLVLQMPFLLAMFNFFPNSIELRQQAFLWAPDLSTYDAPIMLPFTIPFYGNHVSIFTLLMTIATIVSTYFNNQVSTVTGPMKTMGYVMPVVFMFVLNSFPAGLSLYYFVSTVFTVLQQMAIRKFVDEDKIRKTLEENKKKIAANPNKKSRFMSRMEEAMKAQEEVKKRKKK